MSSSSSSSSSGDHVLCSAKFNNGSQQVAGHGVLTRTAVAAAAAAAAVGTSQCTVSGTHQQQLCQVAGQVIRRLIGLCDVVATAAVAAAAVAAASVGARAGWHVITIVTISSSRANNRLTDQARWWTCLKREPDSARLELLCCMLSVLRMEVKMETSVTHQPAD
jgi:hypothetical protein